MEKTTAAPLLPDNPTLPRLQGAAAGCRACELWTRGTQTVFGEGNERARLMLVGEQPGDSEDVEGRPFVGPAGKLLDRALQEAGIDRSQTYVTNVVKHFNWQETRGKRRIHKKPQATHIAACRPWLEAEIDLIRPRVIACLGATAAQALVGKQFRFATGRGQVMPSDLAEYMVATVHPSSILRVEKDEERRLQFQQFVEDLRKIAALLQREPAAARARR